MMLVTLRMMMVIINDDHKVNHDLSDDEDVGDPNNIETSVALFNERP